MVHGRKGVMAQTPFDDFFISCRCAVVPLHHCASLSKETK